MAIGARLCCGADIGIGLTGVAGPDPQDGQPVGTWFCALAGPDGYRDQRAATPAVDVRVAGPGDAAEPSRDPGVMRGRVRAAAVRAALEMLTNIPPTIPATQS
jgi:nicotinamide-nucleotide amidase